MLKLQIDSKENAILDIVKMLIKYNIRAKIEGDEIVLEEGDISISLLSQICNQFKIKSAQNYISNDDNQEIADAIKKEKPSITSNGEKPTINELEYDLKYPFPSEGQIYWTDFGLPDGKGKAYIRPAVVVQNDVISRKSRNILVIPCTTNLNHMDRYTRLLVNLNKESLIDFDPKRINGKPSQIIVDELVTVEKVRLRNYIGTLTPAIMDDIRKRLVFTFNIQSKADEDSNKEEFRDLNLNQLKMLSYVDVAQLLRYKESSISNEEKAKKILETFKFDINQNGVQYLLEAIKISLSYKIFDFDMLLNEITKGKDISVEEARRVIVARVKETLRIKKGTMDFIRLVRVFMSDLSNLEV